MSTAASPIKSLDQVWRSYNENTQLLTLLMEPKEMMGSLASHIELITMKMNVLNKNPIIFIASFSEFTAKQMEVLKIAQQASEMSRQIIADLPQAFQAESAPARSRQFPFHLQLHKLRDLTQTVDHQIESFKDHLRAALLFEGVLTKQREAQ